MCRVRVQVQRSRTGKQVYIFQYTDSYKANPDIADGLRSGGPYPHDLHPSPGPNGHQRGHRVGLAASQREDEARAVLGRRGVSGTAGEADDVDHPGPPPCPTWSCPCPTPSTTSSRTPVWDTAGVRSTRTSISS